MKPILLFFFCLFFYCAHSIIGYSGNPDQHEIFFQDSVASINQNLRYPFKFLSHESGVIIYQNRLNAATKWLVFVNPDQKKTKVIATAKSLQPLSRFSKHCHIAINGGYFVSSGSISLLKINQKIIGYDLQGMCRPKGPVYPSRAVLFIQQGNFSAIWATGKDTKTYRFPWPRDPYATFENRETGTAFQSEEVLGGGPMLIYDFEVVNTLKEEALVKSIAPFSKQPRTAIGIFENQILVFLIIDGRRKHTPGMTIKGIQQMFFEMEAKYALNLDGGGSTTLTKYGSVLNNPSEGRERRIKSGLCVL